MATTLKWMQQKLGLIACFGALVCAAPASTTVPRQTNTKTDPYQKLTVAIFPGGFNWPLWVIKEHGIDNSLGLNIEIVGIRNSEDQMKGLQDGRFDIVMTGFDNVIAYGGGATSHSPPSIKAFMGGDNGLLSLVSKPGLSSYSSLKGRNIGVDSERTGYAFALYGMLLANGLSRGDYTVVKAGGVKQRFEALSAGTIDATLLVTPFDELAVTAGAQRLERVSVALGAYQGYTGATHTKWAKENRRQIVNYIRGYRRALKWLFDPSNKQAALAIYIKHLDGATLEQASLAYKSLIASPNGINRAARFDEKGAANVVRLRKQFGGEIWSPLASPSLYFDRSYYREASRSRDN